MLSYNSNGDRTKDNGRRTLSVLIVDDDPMFMHITTLLLDTSSKFDFSIVGTANNSEACLAKAQALAPDLILIDLNMPGMSALGAIPLLHILFPETRIIALASQVNERVRRIVASAGANGVVAKLTMHMDLIPAISSALDADMMELDPAIYFGETSAQESSLVLPEPLKHRSIISKKEEPVPTGSWRSQLII